MKIHRMPQNGVKRPDELFSLISFAGSTLTSPNGRCALNPTLQ
jgi:hypothetical protein